MSLKKLLIFSFVIFSKLVFPQFKTGMKLYDQYDYAKAIPKFEKAVKKNNGVRKDALRCLADCYYKTKDYKKAELNYQLAIEAGDNSGSTRFNYGSVLKINNKFTEALKHFYIYLEEHPTDPRVKHAIRSCEEIKVWLSRPKEYDVKNLEEINSNQAEFCPVVFEGKLVFVSERQIDLVNYNQYDYNGKPYLNVYFSNLKNEIPSGKIKGFNRRLNSNYHDGPVAFTKDGKRLCLTRVNYIVNKKNKEFVNRAKLFFSTRDGNGWDRLVPFEFNSDDYSCAHPSFSANGEQLFFASDMPGGFGGKDIWMCMKNKDGWSKPINLGPDINTSGDELFPFIREDGILFFSSDGLPGFGGLDIFSARVISDKWILNRNEGLGLNSFADDFGLYFIDNSKGYFSSNREGGKGSDDIYKFTFTSRLLYLDGLVLQSKNLSDPAKNLHLLLKDENGNQISDTRTNTNGYFKFDNLEPDKKYMVKVDENDPAFSGFKKYYYADAKNNIVRVTVVNERGEKYVFRNLPSDPNALPELYAEDDFTMAGNILYGDNPSKPVANALIILKDDNGNIIEEVQTNAFGSFVFSKLPPDENYLLELAESDTPLPPDVKVILTNKSGKEVKIVRTDGKGRFKFTLLASDKISLTELKVSDSDLLMDLNGCLLDPNKNVLANTVIYLIDDKGNMVDTAITDANGKFEFRKLKPGNNYLISIDEKDSKLNDLDKVLIADLKGKILREVIRDRLKGFKFNLLASEKSLMKEVYVDDPWLEVLEMKNSETKKPIVIVENVFYALNAYKPDAAGMRVLDKVIQILVANPDIQIEIGSHTDSRANDKFNLTLSEKRAKNAVDYMIAKGIAKDRLKGVGYGESRLLNNCGNNVACPEEEHAKNRRTEFKVLEKKK